MGNIYRKASLDRLASPEQLDKMIRIASPLLWIEVAGAILVVISVLGWAVFGSLPENANISGIYMSDAGVRSEYVSYGGTVSELLVEKDQKVEEGDVVAVVTNGNLDSNAKQLKERIKAVKKITLKSEEDVSTSDTAQLLEYKIQYKNADLTLEQKQTSLKALEEQLAKTKKEVNKYKDQMDAAESAYLAAIGNDNMNGTTYNYQDAQEKLQTAQTNYSSLVTEQQNLNNNIAGLNQSISELNMQIAAAQEAGNDAQVSALQGQLSELESQKAKQEASLSKVNSSVSSALSKLNSAKKAYNSAKKAYGSAYSSQSAATANQTKLNTDFSQASQLYSNAYSQQIALEQEIANMNTEVSLTGDSTKVDKETLKEQFKETKEALLNSLEAELQSAYDNGAQEEIKAAVSGTVIECGIQEGQLVSQGTEIVRIRSEEGENSEVIRCYAPVAEGKKMKKGMTAVVTPATVDETEYGHINGKVEYVDTYSVSAAEMQRTLGNDSTVEALLQQGPCVEVRISLNQDPDTVSGYEWSNRKGRKLTLEENTPMTVKVRIKEEAPIQKLIPFLKSKLDVKVEAEN